MTDALASRQSLLGSLDLGGRNRRPAKPNDGTAGRSLTTQNSVAARLAKVERHHAREVEERHPVLKLLCRGAARANTIQHLHARHVSMIATKSTSERPRRSMLYSSTLCTVPERIASSNAVWPGRRSRPFFFVGLSMNTLGHHPLSAAIVRRLASLLVGG